MHATRLILWLALAVACTVSAQPTSETYSIKRVLEPSAFRGIHGLAFDAQDRLFAGSVNGQSVYSVDRNNGKVEPVVGPPDGMADDLVFLADGTMVWTSISVGVVRARRGNEPVRVVTDILPSVNSINVRKRDGRLFVGQVFGGDGVWELDPAGVKPPRSIVKNPGGFNGFDIGSDGMLYGPLWFKKQVVRIDPDTGELKVIAEGFGIPAAANFDSRGNLYVLDTARGEVVRVNVSTGAKQVVVRMATSLDNLAIDSQDKIFVSNMADNAIHEVDPVTGKTREVIKGRLSAPRSIAVSSDSGRDSIFVADTFAFRKVDGATGAVTDIARAHAADTPIGYASAVNANARHALVASSDGHVHRFDARSHKLLNSWPDLRGAQAAVELPDGDVVVAGVPRGSLTRLSGAKGENRKQILSGLRGGVALALAASGALYLSESEAGEISEIDLTHGTRRLIAKGLRAPQGLALGTDGSLFVLEPQAQQLTRIDVRTGTATAIASRLPIGTTGIASATASVAAGSRGTLYVLSEVENSIYRLEPLR